MLNRVKTALSITTNIFDTELQGHINAAVKDLNIAGVEGGTVSTLTDDDIVANAIVSYCGYMFEMMHGSLDRSEAYKRAYDEQKAQLSMADGYTVFTGEED